MSEFDEDLRRQSSASTPRYTRRLSDKILIAFHHACDQGDYEVAEQLLRILEMMLTRRPANADPAAMPLAKLTDARLNLMLLHDRGRAVA